MNNSIKPSSAKREFYSQPQIASAYDELRFGGASGAWVNQREIELMLDLVPPFHRALDLGCGTGRLTRVLAQRGATMGIDASNAMLAQARELSTDKLVQGDAFTLPFADVSFDVVVASRVVFHFERAENLLREMARVVAPGGAIIFDTYRWSPRAWLPFDAVRWGGGVFAHSPAQIEHIARELNLHIAQCESAFLFSPYIYRRLPIGLVHLLARLESYVPVQMRSRSFWKLVRNN
jgi:ubiquinone/menaquinone biosynthesis C-methylase UbiE